MNKDPAPLLLTDHAQEQLVKRGIPESLVRETIAAPDAVHEGRFPRTVLVKHYFDEKLNRAMLIRMVVEFTREAVVVVTVHKTSKFRKYLPESPHAD